MNYISLKHVNLPICGYAEIMEVLSIEKKFHVSV